MAAAANRGRSWETPAPRRTRASSRHLPSHTAPLMSFEPNLAAPEPRLLTWRWKNLGPGSGRQMQLSRPRVLPASLGPLPVGERHSSGKNSDGYVSPRWPFPAAKHFSPGKASGRPCGVRTPRELRAAGVAGPMTGALWPLWGGHACPHRKARLQAPPLLSLILLWTPCALPGPPQGSQSKNLLAFFLIAESPSAPQRGLEPLAALPCP